MVTVEKQGIVLQKTDQGFESDGVLNPAVIEHNGEIHLFYRAVARPNYSTIGYCRLSEPITVTERLDYPILYPQFEYEDCGVEDPRIVCIDGLFYLTYTAYDGVNALGCLATSTDLKQFEKQGVIVPQVTYLEFKHLAESKGIINEKYSRFNSKNVANEKPGIKPYLWDKNVIFFPRRINGKLCFLHRIKPDIQLVTVDALSELTHEFWQNYLLHLEQYIVLAPRYKHEVSYIGGGCPPIETEKGWLMIYHGVHDTVNGYVYSACAALLDLENPLNELGRLPYALFKPDQAWELKGEVNNVCFPTGAVRRGDTLHIYYGAADEQIATATVNIPELLEALLDERSRTQTEKKDETYWKQDQHTIL